MNRSTTLLVAVLVTLLGAAAGARAEPVLPDGAPAPVRLEISGRVYRYFPLTVEAPMTLTVDGPALFEPIMRWRFDSGLDAVDVDVEVLVNGVPQWHRVFRATPGGAQYVEHSGWKPGRSSRLSLEIPRGTHTIELRLVAPTEGVLDINPVVGPPHVMPWVLRWRAELGTAYDSNIFRYADSDVDDFLDGREGDRYPVEYVDDLRVEPSVDLSFVREEPGRREAEIRLSADWRLATVNGEKSFAKLGVRVKESRDGFGYATLGYSAIPGYHVRYLWDGDVDAGSPYRSCDFRQHTVRAEVGSDRSLPIDLRARLKYDYLGYDQDFVEYDSDVWTAGVAAVARPVRGVRIDLGYALRVLTARGYDEIGETRETSDDSDVSYEQDEYSARVRWDVREVAGLPTVLTLSGRLSRRYYQTETSGADDPYHAGRSDTYWTISARSRHELAPDIALEAFYEHRGRTAESDYVDDIGVSKDYSADRVGLKLIVWGERFLD